MVRPVTVVLGEFGLVMVPVPLTNVHVPTAGDVAMLPASCADVLGVHRCWFGPASAAGWATLKFTTVT